MFELVVVDPAELVADHFEPARGRVVSGKPEHIQVVAAQSAANPTKTISGTPRISFQPPPTARFVRRRGQSPAIV